MVAVLVLGLLGWGVWVLGSWAIGQVSGLFEDDAAASAEENSEDAGNEDGQDGDSAADNGDDDGIDDPDACDPADLRVSMDLDADASRTFVLSARNDAAEACLLDAGILGVVVHSGEDRVWSTHDCSPPGERLLLLPAGDETEVSRSWDGRRSVPGCEGDRAFAQPGTYRAQAALDGDEGSLEASATFVIGG